MLAIYKKELKTYFTSMIGYVFLAVFLIIVGLYFGVLNLLQTSTKIEYTLSSITFLFIVSVPLLTMRVMAEENKQKTDQLLYTAPVTAGSIVVGKFLALFSILGIGMLVVCTYPLILSLYGNIPFASGYAGILAFTLLGAAYLSIGLFISALTESQVVAAVLTYIVFIITLLMDSIASIVPKDNRTALFVFAVMILILCVVLYQMVKNYVVTIGTGLICEAALYVLYLFKPTLFDGALLKVLNWFSVIGRYDSFYYGAFNVAALVYYISVIVLFIFLTTQVIKKKRWS